MSVKVETVHKKIRLCSEYIHFNGVFKKYEVNIILHTVHIAVRYKVVALTKDFG